jgi:hypothetical protein
MHTIVMSGYDVDHVGELDFESSFFLYDSPVRHGRDGDFDFGCDCGDEFFYYESLDSLIII